MKVMFFFNVQHTSLDTSYLDLCCEIYYAQSVLEKNGWECAFACLFTVPVCGHAMDCLLSFLLPTMIYIRQILSSGWVFFPLHYMPSSQLCFRVPEVFLEFRESTFVDVTETRWEVQNWSFVLRLCVVNDAWNARNVSELIFLTLFRSVLSGVSWCRQHDWMLNLLPVKENTIGFLTPAWLWLVCNLCSVRC